MKSMIRCAVDKRTGKVTTKLAHRPSPSPAPRSDTGVPASSMLSSKEGAEDSIAKKRKRPSESDQTEVQTVDLTADELPNVLPSPAAPTKRQRTSEAVSDLETQTPSASAASLAIVDDVPSARQGVRVQATPPPSQPASQAMTSATKASQNHTDTIPTFHKDVTTYQARPLVIGLLTPQTTPAKKKQLQLHELPELADHLVPKVSTAENIEYTNPAKFSLSPPYWKRWPAMKYAAFADYVRSRLDLIPFARQHDRPLEEVQQVFDAVVCNPLYNEKEAKRRAEKGMRKQFDYANQFSTPMRHWGNPDEALAYGKLAGVEKAGFVLLTLENGCKHEIAVGKLMDDDVMYLYDNLTKQAKEFLGPITSMRYWGRPRETDGKRPLGSVTGVEEGVVVLMPKVSAPKVPAPKVPAQYKLKLKSLVAADIRFLIKTLSSEDRRLLWKGEDEAGDDDDD